jgi:CheY-like chemotaxis protein
MPIWMAVEDEADIHTVIMGMFEIWGIAGVSFETGTEAVAWLDTVDNGKIRGELPALALIDIRLPGVSGLDVSRRIRQSPRLRDIPIVLTTAYHLRHADELDAMRHAQADALIYKPLPPMEELREILNGVIASRNVPEEGGANPASYIGSL